MRNPSMFIQLLLAMVYSPCSAEVDAVTTRLGENGTIDFPLNWVKYKGKTLEYNLHVYAPAASSLNDNSTLPVVFFIGGVAGNVFVSLYSDLLIRVASRGFVILGMDHTHFPSYFTDAEGFNTVVDWARDGNLQAEMAKHGITYGPDIEGRAAYMAQSAGNHVAGQAIKDKCSVAKAFVMIDPVDGADPYRIITSQDLITPGQKLNFTIPGLILDNALDPVPANFATPPCMPIGVGTPRWIAAWSGPVWNINATDYGHVDCLNDASGGGTAGLVCKQNPKTDKVAYREMLAQMATTFLDALFKHEPSKFSVLEKQSSFDIAVTLKQDLKGLSHDQIKPGCTNDPSVMVV